MDNKYKEICKPYADLSGADLSGADLRGANLRGASLTYADLSGADLRGANLTYADLRGANLTYADLSGADLRGASLTYADLSGANLSGANLTYADLRGANLSGAYLDFSCWPLWCGSIGVKVDVKIARQLVYHAFAVDCDDEEFLTLRKLVCDFSNKFHRIKTGDVLKLEDLKLNDKT